MTVPVGYQRLRQARAAENFPVALRVLPAAVRRDLRALYDYARYVDDLGDEPLPGRTAPDRLASLDRFEAELRGLYAGRPPRHPVLRELAGTVRDRGLPLEPLLRLIAANQMDQRVTRYATMDQLVDYCRLSANPVGELVLHVFGQVSRHRIMLSDRVCTALQLIEHLQDAGQDRARGRIYLPAADLRRFGVDPDDLARPVAGANVRALVRFEAARARDWLESGTELLPTLRGWCRLAVGGYLAGGRAALDALAAGDHDPLSAARKPRRRHVFGHWLAAIVRSVR